MTMLGKRSLARVRWRARRTNLACARERAVQHRIRLGLAACACACVALLSDCAEQHQQPTGPEQASTNASEPADKDQATPVDAAVATMVMDAGFDGGAAVAQADAGTSAPPATADDGCSQSAQRWIDIAQANCVACHGRRSPGKGGFFTVLDVDALVASGKVVPGQPDSSPLYMKLSSGAMPPADRTQRPSADDVQAVRSWITCGAPKVMTPACETDCTTFVEISSRLQLLLKDVQALPAEQQSDVRYLDLTVQGNAGQGASRLELYRDGLSYLVNSLSTNAAIAAPQAVDSQGLLFRIRLSDYGWTASTWERIVSGYPYAVTYNPDSRTFPVEEGNADQLRQLTGTDTPYIQADWFFSQAIRPPLYYDLLGTPATLSQLEDTLGIDIAANIANDNVVRAGFQDSGPSSYNRVIERHSLGDVRGALWLTYDFAAGAGTSNVLIHPRDFRASSSEILWNLPNGLYAYMIVDGRGTRLDKAPNNAVQDPNARDQALETGISCISCHTDEGVIPRDDEVRKAAMVSNSNSADLDEVLKIYVDDDTRNAVFAADQARYQKARVATRVAAFVDVSAHVLDNAYVGLMGMKDVAGVVGIPSDKLSAAISASPRIFAPEFLALQAVGTRVPRETFDTLFSDLVAALGLGQSRAQP